VLCSATNVAISGCQLIGRHDILASLGRNGPHLCYMRMAKKLCISLCPNYLVHLLVLVFCPLVVVSEW
jgi:hypothetical protein